MSVRRAVRAVEQAQLFLLPLAAMTALLLTGCKEAALPPAPPRPVVTMTIEPVTTETFGPFASTVEPRYQSQLGFQTSGRMIARDVYIGDAVKKGQRLAALDPTLAQFAVTRAKANVADAKAQVANTEGIASRQRILAGGGNATQAALDNAVAGLATTKARLEQMQAALRVSEDQIGYTELDATFDGVVTAWSAEVGQYITTGQSVVTIARPDVREAVVDIPDELIRGVSPGMDFLVRVQAAPQFTTKARVREIGPLADSATRTHRVRMTLEDPPRAFRIGTMITASVTREIAPKILVPPRAVVDDDGKRWVWMLAKDGASVSRREVTISGSEGDKALVASGLAGGDRIVTVGVNSLHEGEAVAGEMPMSVTAASAR